MFPACAWSWGQSLVSLNCRESTWQKRQMTLPQIASNISGSNEAHWEGARAEDPQTLRFGCFVLFYLMEYKVAFPKLF